MSSYVVMGEFHTLPSSSPSTHPLFTTCTYIYISIFQCVSNCLLASHLSFVLFLTFGFYYPIKKIFKTF
eukprot:UN02666